MLINSKKFNFLFFLSNKKQVASLEEGALQYGGATKINNKVFSNIPGNEYIRVNNKNNILSIFVPSTIDINKSVDNSYYISYSVSYIQNLYKNKGIKYEMTQGSWYSDTLQKVVYDDITIISIELDIITEQDIENFIKLAEYIKSEMQQEGVTITINDALAII